MNNRQLKLALAASLAVNLFLAGLMAGGVLRSDRHGDRVKHPDPSGRRFAAVAERLDPADAQALRTLMQRQSERTQPRVLAIKAARRDVEAAMSRSEFDPAAARAAVARVRTEEAALRQEVDTALIDFAVGLEPDERAALVPLLRKGARGWRDRQGETARANRPQDPSQDRR